MGFNFYRSKFSNSKPTSLSSLEGQSPGTPSATLNQSLLNEKEGLTAIKVSKAVIAKEECTLIYQRVVEKYKVPQDSQFSLFHAIRFSKSLNSYQERHRMTCLRLIAFASYSYLLKEEELTSTFFIFEPDLISGVCEIIQNEEQSMHAKVIAISALESLCKFKGRLGEVLQCIGASVNHGILMKTLRQVIVAMDEPEIKYSAEFVDAVYSLVSYLLSTQTAGTCLISAGIIQLLIQAVNVQNPKHFKVCF